jgi:hypothetical protein
LDDEDNEPQYKMIDVPNDDDSTDEDEPEFG